MCTGAEILVILFMRIKWLLILALFGFSLSAQEQMELNNLDGFKDQSGNWQIVGEVTVNRNMSMCMTLKTIATKLNQKEREGERRRNPKSQNRSRLNPEQEFF